MVNGVASATRLGGKYERRKLWNHGVEVEVYIAVYTNEYIRVGDIASAEGAMLRLPKARSPFRLGDLGSVVSSPSGDLGRSPRNRRDFEHFMRNGVHFCKISYFLTITLKKEYLKL